MEKGHPPQEAAPPYPGPPLNYGSGAPPEMYPPPPFAPSAPPPGFYAGGAAYPPAQPAPVTVTHVVVSPALQDLPGHTVCPHCHQSVITKTEHTPGLLTWAICGGLAFFGCFLCCCIPFCIDSCQDVRHHCSSCNRFIHLYKRM